MKLKKTGKFTLIEPSALYPEYSVVEDQSEVTSILRGTFPAKKDAEDFLKLINNQHRR